MKTTCPVFSKAGRRVTSHLRHWLIEAGMDGTKSYLLRAGRYSIHQFLRSFSALFAIVLLVPRIVRCGFLSIKKNVSEPKWIRNGKAWSFMTGSYVAVKDAFMGIPSLLRSGWAAFKAQIYGWGAMMYHCSESAKHFLIGLTGSFSHFPRAVSHAFQAALESVKGTFLACSIMFTHFGAYFSGIWDSFKSGTSKTVMLLREKEKSWSVTFVNRFDNGRDYVTRSLSTVLTPIGAFFGKLWEYVSAAGGGISSGAYVARNKAKFVVVEVGNKVNDVGHKMHDAAVDVGHMFQSAGQKVGSGMKNVHIKVQDTAAEVGHRVRDSAVGVSHLVHDSAAGVSHKVHDAALRTKYVIGDAEGKVVVHMKTTADTIRARASDLIDGIKVGTVHVIHKVKDGYPVIQEKVVLYVKTSSARSKEMLQLGLIKGKGTAALIRTKISTGSHRVSSSLVSVGKSTRNFLETLTRPFTVPIIYVIQLPSRAFHTVTITPVGTYVYILSLFGFASYLGLAMRARYNREQYGRKVGFHKKVTL